MFSKTLKVLLIVLLGQIVFITWAVKNNSQETTEKTRLIVLNRDDIAEIVIEKSGQPVLVLKKNDGNWMLVKPEKASAKISKVDNLLSRLLTIKSSWPVAKTETSIKQLRVGKQNYLAKIDLIMKSQEKLTLLLGLSSGVNSNYARIDGSNDIYQIPFNALELSVRPEYWRDKVADK